jgi:hypothetical protein
MDSAKVSVIIPIYKGNDFLPAAIQTVIAACRYVEATGKGVSEFGRGLKNNQPYLAAWQTGTITFLRRKRFLASPEAWPCLVLLCYKMAFMERAHTRNSNVSEEARGLEF